MRIESDVQIEGVQLLVCLFSILVYEFLRHLPRNKLFRAQVLKLNIWQSPLLLLNFFDYIEYTQ